MPYIEYALEGPVEGVGENYKKTFRNGVQVTGCNAINPLQVSRMQIRPKICQ